MVVVQKIDHRKRSERKLFFSLKIIPIFVLAIMVLLLIFDNNQNPKELISGNVAKTISLNDLEYSSGESLNGGLKLFLNQTDYLPLGMEVNVNVLGICPQYYICADGTEILYKDENCTEVESDPSSCDGGFQPYNCTGSTGYGKTCCPNTGVAGKLYMNLKCSNVPSYISSSGLGVCGDSCSSSFKKDLSYFISKSNTPTRWNITNGTFQFLNGSTVVPLGGEGLRASYCFSTNTGKGFNTPFVSRACNDSDGNASWIKNVCHDINGDWEDFCAGGGLYERYCRQNFVDYNCSACSLPFCKYPGTESEGWYANCTEGGNLITKRITFATCDGLSPSLYGPQCLMPSKMSWALMPYCDSELIECSSCSDGKCAEESGNCSGWSPANVYESPFSKLGINAPSKGGTYFVALALGWNNSILISSTSSNFIVFPQHKECVDNKCKLVDGPGDNECNSTADCEDTCDTNWNCGSWGACINGQRSRTCTDLNSCGTSVGKPAEQEPCSCSPSWNCSWQMCASGSSQNNLCVDSMNCNPNNLSYVSETRNCCEEEWDCTKWSKCSNLIQTRNCLEVTNCGTTFSMPEIQKNCKEGGGFPWVVVIIVVLLLIVGFLVWLIFLRRRIERDRFVGIGGGNFESSEPSDFSGGEQTSFEPRREVVERPTRRTVVQPRKREQTESDYGPSLNSREYSNQLDKPRRRIIKKKERTIIEEDNIPDAPA